MRFLLLLVDVFASATALCPTGFTLAYNGQCHKEVEDAKYDDTNNEGSQAKKECALFQAMPVIIKNQNDQDYWSSVASENHKKGDNKGYIYLGLECNSKSKWQWMDGSNVTYRPTGGDSAALDEWCDNSFNDPWAWKCMWAINHITYEWDQMCFQKHDLDVYCVFTPTYTPVDVDEDCSNFSYDGGDDICYQVQKTPTTFADATSVCYSFGAKLASIHNDRENSFIRRLAVSKNLVSSVMVGGTRNSQNSFGWTDGTQFDYQNFAPGFPDKYSGDCLAVQTDNVNGQWKNVNCTDAHPFACVRPTGTKMPACGAQYKEGDIIYSPGFPSSASESCDFVLIVDAGKLVEVEILFLEANSCCDHLVLSEGSLGGSHIAEEHDKNRICGLSGDQQNGQKFRTSTQNVMRASWQPNGGLNVRGMMITFRGVPKS